MATVSVKSRFLTGLQMTPLLGGDRMWLIDEDLVYYSEIFAGNIVVPTGFVCDLNSIPRPFWVFSPPTDFPHAGIVHDFLYRFNLVPRAKADAIYREALEACGAGSTRRFIRYWGLRLGGSRAYKKHTAKAQ